MLTKMLWLQKWGIHNYGSFINCIYHVSGGSVFCLEYSCSGRIYSFLLCWPTFSSELFFLGPKSSLSLSFSLSLSLSLAMFYATSEHYARACENTRLLLITFITITYTDTGTGGRPVMIYTLSRTKSKYHSHLGVWKKSAVIASCARKAVITRIQERVALLNFCGRLSPQHTFDRKRNASGVGAEALNVKRAKKIFPWSA